jgi:E3 ubiquitin-protein ligase BRE1
MTDSVDELIQKFNKRWTELTGSEEMAEADSKLIPMIDEDRLEIELTKKNTDLQHRLEQALENVRQADSTRETLKSAISLNASLQVKLDEVKGKYAAVQATRGSSRSGITKDGVAVDAAKPETKHGGAVVLGNGGHAKASSTASHHVKETSSHEGKTNGETTGGESNNNNNYDKLYMSYKKLRRDLNAAITSKETAKAKLERAEKERESLLDTNIKLVKQISEKEDMNAQSLSTILHLKGMTEKLKEERDLLEQEAKAASQLAVSARLTTNAKAKVSEELENERSALVSRIQELEAACSILRTDLKTMSSQRADATGKLAVKDIELEKVVQRSEELANELASKREEIRKLNGKFEESEQEAKRVSERLAGADPTPAMNGESDESATFSVDQLQTQVKFLKNRLGCPVCHYRDKECIIMRCRHMHCKQCVEERVSNRSRKCPTCNLKFSENDVQDVWLN